MSDDGTDIAIYTLYATSDDELEVISTACEKRTAKSANGGAAGYMFHAPQSQHQNVCAVVEYHHPNYVIAEVPDWREKGILAGMEDDDEADARVRGYDTHRFKASAIGVIFINLQIANLGRLEYKEWSDIEPDAPSSDDEEDNGDGDSDDERGERRAEPRQANRTRSRTFNPSGE
ncbi:hypothetical protein BD309DRAFT_1004817 [Dichomitus squalens]|uniref:Uncharacterized protein n=1 Tax=Dichomitus squalens TaxID=114155 RepID=A0A4Q9NBK4_9APHY|nr:hypothetical protein BD309DRAFT_1004817 [Dichomitus squalens]TBU57541.1 hypothetical protein BD310DRAFT_949389 [Dichomitus squalens]